MRYEDTGNFNDKQKKLIKEFQEIAKKLKESGCVLVSTEFCLNVFLKKDWNHAELRNNPDYDHPIKGEYIDIINGSVDGEYFPMGFIDED